MSILKWVVLLSISFYLLVLLILYLAQEAFIYLPKSLEAEYEFEFNHEAEELFLEMKDGARLNALHFKRDTTKGLILYFHGNADNLARWGGIVQYHVGLGYDVLVMDYRGYGKSTGKRSYRVMLSDAEEFYNYALGLYKESEIIIYGRSLGTGFASWLAGKYQPRALFLETPYTSIADMGSYFYPLAPSKWLIRSNFIPSEYLKTATSPIYIFHGDQDLTVPLQLGQNLYDQLEQSKEIEIFVISGGGHNNLIEFPSFRSRVELLLQ